MTAVAVLAIAIVTERVRPGTVHSYQAGAKYDPLEPGKAGSIDRGGVYEPLDPVTVGIQECSGRSATTPVW